jgi:hypothetical protein
MKCEGKVDFGYDPAWKSPSMLSLLKYSEATGNWEVKVLATWWCLTQGEMSAKGNFW